MSKRKVHKLETEDHGRYEYHWILCRDPENFQEPDGRRYIAEHAWYRVTCRHCLKHAPSHFKAAEQEAGMSDEMATTPSCSRCGFGRSGSLFGGLCLGCVVATQQDRIHELQRQNIVEIHFLERDNRSLKARIAVLERVREAAIADLKSSRDAHVELFKLTDAEWLAEMTETEKTLWEALKAAAEDSENLRPGAMEPAVGEGEGEK